MKDNIYFTKQNYILTLKLKQEKPQHQQDPQEKRNIKNIKKLVITAR